MYRLRSKYACTDDDVVSTKYKKHEVRVRYVPFYFVLHRRMLVVSCVML